MLSRCWLDVAWSSDEGVWAMWDGLSARENRKQPTKLQGFIDNYFTTPTNSAVCAMQSTVVFKHDGNENGSASASFGEPLALRPRHLAAF